jgi:hypothetical protein
LKSVGSQIPLHCHRDRGQKAFTRRFPLRPVIGTPAANSAASVAATSPIFRAMWVNPACFSATSIRIFDDFGADAFTIKFISRPSGLADREGSLLSELAKLDQTLLKPSALHPSDPTPLENGWLIDK